LRFAFAANRTHSEAAFSSQVLERSLGPGRGNGGESTQHSAVTLKENYLSRRRRANASYLESHATDVATSVIFGIDLTPLIKDPSLELKQYIAGFINRFAEEVSSRLAKLS